MPSKLIYDADCGFCTVSAHWIEERWLSSEVSLVASRDLDDNQLAAFGLTRLSVESAVQWIDSDSNAHAGARAIGLALLATSGWTRLAGRVINAPPARWIAPFFYRLLAANRHRLPGGTAECKINT
ncbi:MAG: DUF393 domain-containing protein [Actinomycetes bacterium]